MAGLSRDVLLQTGAMAQATAFYRDVLGLTVFLEQDNLVGLEAGAFRLFLDRGPAYGPVFEVIVADLASARNRLVAAGCVVTQDDPAIPRCYLRDPFGLIFNLAERAPGQS